MQSGAAQRPENYIYCAARLDSDLGRRNAAGRTTGSPSLLSCIDGETAQPVSHTPFLHWVAAAGESLIPVIPAYIPGTVYHGSEHLDKSFKLSGFLLPIAFP